jgi:hypothetical protein
MGWGLRTNFPKSLGWTRLAGVVCALGVLSGCSMFGRGGDEPETTAATTPAAASEEEIDIRRYLGPDYCPELRVLSGAELMRRYERGHEEDPAFVIWQASVGKTARECLFDLQGGLTLKVGVSGRVIAGPKGGPATVSVPLKIAVVKYKEALLAEQDYTIDVAIPPAGSTVFTQVKEILVPSPGSDRDYLIYVGFDVGEWDPINGEAATIAVVEEPPPPPPEPEAPLPTEPTTPKVLPTPTDGFVLQ